MIQWAKGKLWNWKKRGKNPQKKKTKKVFWLFHKSAVLFLNISKVFVKHCAYSVAFLTLHSLLVTLRTTTRNIKMSAYWSLSLLSHFLRVFLTINSHYLSTQHSPTVLSNEIKLFFCEVRTESLYVMQINFTLQRVKADTSRVHFSHISVLSKE
jgi:hypothetical protein